MDYRRLCRRLIAEIRRLRDENAALLDTHWAYQEHRRQARYIDDCSRREREKEEVEEVCRFFERARALDDLERSCRSGDYHAGERALRRLRLSI